MSSIEKKFILAGDVSLIIASGKFFLYKQALLRVQSSLRDKKTKHGEMVKRLTLEYVSNLPDRYFFVPLEIATSRKAIEEYLGRRFEQKHILETAQEDIKKMVAERQSKLDD